MITVQASVLIVDDHSSVASAVAVALRASGFNSVLVVDSFDLGLESVLDRARTFRPKIVMLDLYLDRKCLSLPLIVPLVEMGASVLLFTSCTDPRLLSAALRAGATGVVDKATSFDTVLSALRHLADGDALMPPETRQALIDELESSLSAEEERCRGFQLLTPREADVLNHLIGGVAPKQIARTDGISVSTVRGHIERIFQKLEVSSQREALALARAANWPDNADQTRSLRADHLP